MYQYLGEDHREIFKSYNHLLLCIIRQYVSYDPCLSFYNNDE